MAIQITKQGRLPAEERFSGKCHKCRTEIECLRRDVKEQSGGYNETLYVVPCPLCGNALYVDPIKGA